VFSFCLFCVLVPPVYCVRLTFFSTQLSDWLQRISPKCPVLCRMGCKTVTRSVSSEIYCVMAAKGSISN